MPITPVSFDDNAPADDSQYDDIVNEVTEEQPEEEVAPQASIDSRMAEMEERLEMIQYYKLLLNGGFFNNPPNQSVASKIESEVAEFILGRLDSLLNMGATPAKQRSEAQFTDEEVSALKELANPDTHKVLTEVVSRVFSKVASGTVKKAPPKAEPPKLATKTVPEAPAPKKAAPAPMTVKARPVATRPAAKPAAPVPTQEAPTPPKKQAPGQQKKQFRTVPKVDQKTGEVVGQVQVDATPQARPMGAIQPLPVATSKAEIEMQMENSARRTSNMGLNIFDAKLTQ